MSDGQPDIGAQLHAMKGMQSEGGEHSSSAMAAGGDKLFQEGVEQNATKLVSGTMPNLGTGASMDAMYQGLGGSLESNPLTDAFDGNFIGYASAMPGGVREMAELNGGGQMGADNLSFAKQNNLPEKAVSLSSGASQGH